MEELKLADDLTLKTVSKRGKREAYARALAFTPSGQAESVWVKRFREGLRIDAGGRKLDLHYSQIAEIKLVGQSTVSQQRSVVGRAVVGKVVAGETGALVGALSGLQNTQQTFNRFAITFWDAAAKDLKQVCLEDTGLTLPHVMELAAEDMQACHRGEDPDNLPDPDAAAKRFLGYFIAGVIAVVVLYYVFSSDSPPTGPYDSAVYEKMFATQESANPKVAAVESAPTVAAAATPQSSQQTHETPREETAAAAGPAPAAATRTEADVPVQQVSKDETNPATTDGGTTAQVRPAQSEMQTAIFTAKPNESQKPSFDCARASTAAEKRICANSELAALDRNLNQLYSAVRTPTNEMDIRMEQLAWLKTRSGCLSDFCLKTAYEKRIEQLRRHQQ